MKKSYISLAVACLSSTGVFAADALLEEVVTSVNRYEQKAFDTAASVNVVNKSQIQDEQPMILLSESLLKIPGISAGFHNYAQDLMISSRGFGANSNFGARGIKIYVDGIPATIADGQGQVSHIDLASAEKIEVIRGPFASIYGNSAGGVINVYSEKALPGTSQVETYGSFGSFGTSRFGVKALGSSNDINYLLDGSEVTTNGYRDHGGASRNNDNAKFGFNLGGDSQITLVGNKVSIRAQDPLGLNSSQITQGSRSYGFNTSSANADNYNTRKSVDQIQGGVEYLKKINSLEFIKIAAYSGERSQSQVAASTTALGLSRSYSGLDAQYTSQIEVASLISKLTLGSSYDHSKDRSTGNAYAQSTQSITTLTSDANYLATSFDQYAQLETYLTDRVTLNTGLRHTNINLEADYIYGAPSWANQYKDYSATLPMMSLMYAINSNTNIYASVGKGFDTPTLNQIKYSCTTTPSCTAASKSPNMSLMPSNTIQYEVGVKQKWAGLGSVTLALFEAETKNEIVLLYNNAGSTVFTNAPKTKREGIEFSTQLILPNNFGVSTSYTYLLAQIKSQYPGFEGSVQAGNLIAGVPRNKLFADFFWRKSDQSIDYGVEMEVASKMFADDANTAAAPGYASFNLRAGLKQYGGNWTLSEFFRVNNIANKYYVNSLIVNQASAYYFEPTAGRNYVVGIRANYNF